MRWNDAAERHPTARPATGCNVVEVAIAKQIVCSGYLAATGISGWTGVQRTGLHRLCRRASATPQRPPPQPCAWNPASLGIAGGDNGVFHCASLGLRPGTLPCAMCTSIEAQTGRQEAGGGVTGASKTCPRQGGRCPSSRSSCLRRWPGNSAPPIADCMGCAISSRAIVRRLLPDLGCALQQNRSAHLRLRKDRVRVFYR